MELSAKKYPALFLGQIGLVLAPLGCFAGGWLLRLFEAPEGLAIATFLVLLYIVWTTTESIFLSNLGLTLLLWVAVARRPWPGPWEAISPWNAPSQWAMTLLLLWFLGMLLLNLLAFTSQLWQRRGPAQIWRYLLTFWWGGALALGWLV